MSDIFISYASADRERARPLVEALRAEGWSVWWDPHIRAGETWDEVIEAALDESKCVVALWSKRSIKSKWVRLEANQGMQRGILVPAFLDYVSVPLAFTMVQAADLVAWSPGSPHSGFDQLTEAISHKVPRTTSAPQGARPASKPEAPKQNTRPFWQIFNPGKPKQKLHLSALRKKSVLGFAAAALIVIGATSFAFLQKTQVEAPVVEVRTSSINGLDYVWIPAGRFTMGCSPGDGSCAGDEKPAHQVTIPHGFWMGRTEVTEAAYARFPKAGRKAVHPDLPVTEVTGDEAKDYCQWAGQRLPTEGEWEYAARAKTTKSQYGPPDEIAWYPANSGGSVHPVGGKRPNAWGLYDMLGNVWEWVANSDIYNYDVYKDIYDYNGQAMEDEVVLSSERPGILRGGSWSGGPISVSYRNRVTLPDLRTDNVGFRCVGELR